MPLSLLKSVQVHFLYDFPILPEVPIHSQHLERTSGYDPKT